MPAEVTAGTGFVAVRCPSHPIARPVAPSGGRTSLTLRAKSVLHFLNHTNTRQNKAERASLFACLCLVEDFCICMHLFLLKTAQIARQLVEAAGVRGTQLVKSDLLGRLDLRNSHIAIDCTMSPKDCELLLLYYKICKSFVACNRITGLGHSTGSSSASWDPSLCPLGAFGCTIGESLRAHFPNPP